MADEDDLSLDDTGSIGSAPSQKGGFLGGVLPSLLKWIAISVGGIVIVVTVVVITMSIINSNSPKTVAIPISDEYQPKREVYEWYQGLPDVRTKTIDEIPASVIVKVAIGYKVDDKAASNELILRKVDIQDYLRKYFSAKRKSELTPQNEDLLKLEIKNDINDILTSSSIKDVKFTGFDVVEQ